MSPAIHPMYINGAWREGCDGGVADDINPATGEVFARIAQDVEHALALANDTRAGLSYAVITNDLQKAMDFALHINDSTIADEPHIDFGGVKDSGFGREGGMASIVEMTEVKWITIQMGQREFPF
jgi:acyl-CoA reductase-like NAD-dependent aldehyde dehydrogenase